MELYLSNKKKSQIERDVSAIKTLCCKMGFQILPCSRAVQKAALTILSQHRDVLGRNAITDSLIIGLGRTRRAYLVTRDRQWTALAGHLGRYVTVVSPDQLLREW